MFPFVSTKNIDMVTARDHTWLESVKIFCPNLPYWKFRIFFIFFLLNRNVIFAEKLQNGLYFETSTAKMWNPNKKYYTYHERSWYELFKTAKKFQNFSYLSFWTYWMKKSQKNQSECRNSKFFRKFLIMLDFSKSIVISNIVRNFCRAC